MPERPNILVIMTDQQRGDCLSAEGHPVLMTPNMDTIAAHGVRFSRFYSPCPTCIATRATMLSGKMPQTHGMVGYKGSTELPLEPTLPQVLRDAGYHTGLVGRNMHQFPERKRWGFDDMVIAERHLGTCDYSRWLAQVGPPDNDGWFSSGVMHNDWTVRPWPYDDYLHRTNWTTSQALRWLERRDPTCPFFLVVSYLAPHPPLQPPAFYYERYLRTGVPDPVIGDWVDHDAPGRDTTLVDPQHVNLQGEQLLSARAAYYGCINHIDDQIRRILSPVHGILKQTRGNTVVCFTSDHGEMLGDHLCWRKGFAYEPSACVPFLLQAPERFELQPGSASNVLATHADIMPTLLELAGADIPDTVDGHSLLAAARGDASPVREHLAIEHSGYGHAITDSRYKYIRYPEDGTEQLFDLVDDPTECTNLVGHPDLAEVLSTMRDRLIRHLEGRPEGFVRDGKLVTGVDQVPLIPGRFGDDRLGRY